MASSELDKILQSTAEQITNFSEHFKEDPEKTAETELDALVNSLKESNQALGNVQGGDLQEKTIQNIERAIQTVQQDKDLQEKAAALMTSIHMPMLMSALNESQNLLKNLHESLKRGERVKDIDEQQQL